MCHNLLKFSARKQISEVNFPLSKMTGVRKALKFSRPNIIYNTSVKKKKKNVVTVKNLPEVFCERSKSSRSCIIFFWNNATKSQTMGPKNLEEARQRVFFADDVILELGQWNKRRKWLAELASLSLSQHLAVHTRSWQRWGVGGNGLLSPPLYMLSNTCWNGGVHPALHCFAKKK